VKTLLLALLFFLSPMLAHAIQNAKIMGDVVEVYQSDDFDSEIIDEVHKGEVYKISSKLYGPFYRIKLKSGKIGYIVDYELDIEGKGPFKEKDLDEMTLQEAIDAKAPALNPADEAEEQEVFGKALSGPMLLVYNYHENTMGGDQVDELAAIGYRYIRTFTWSVAASFQLPKYYSSGGRSGQALQVWGDFGFSNDITQMKTAALRFSGNAFVHLSHIKLDTPNDSYQMDDATAGINAELGYLKSFQNFAVDISAKYYFDKSNYAALILAVLF
jgi:hypothetical protein